MPEDKTNRAPDHRVYGGLKTATYHIVTASSVALEDWTAICGRLVDQNRHSHLWVEGDAYCSDCEDLAGPAMRDQIAREEASHLRRDWGITPT
jgi:hypothetical protein